MKNRYKWLITHLEPVRESILQIFAYKDIFQESKAIVIMENHEEDKLLELSSLGRYTRKKDIAFPLIVSRNFCAPIPGLISLGIHRYHQLQR